MKAPFPEFEPEEPDEAEASSGRLRDIPLRMLVPNLITLGAICSGLTAVRLAFDGRFEFAVVAIVFAAILDGLDGRMARLLESSTPFGEQMDSLADFVNFGVAPAMVLYLYVLNDLHTMGWIVALVFAICGCLRLARFNVMLEAPDRPKWQTNFFTGVPAPAGALLALLPVYLGLIGLEKSTSVALLSAMFMLFVAFLMVSNLPTWSGKQIGGRISRRIVLPLMIGVTLLVIFLFSYPWGFLTTLCVIYLATLPFSVREWNKRSEADTKSAE
ncbi:CDP-diacylglycerol--serine O-phosphatidyltransferase [Pseudahrensia aquimaris]|uniref:CDP-diacylglycerol--serine O-phosphatidyltransferase n=1 Tax=Pseudahrensia aquimaris TaxID=744461 RepID=A0ABW3FBA7_9HYPH